MLLARFKHTNRVFTRYLASRLANSTNCQGKRSQYHTSYRYSSAQQKQKQPYKSQNSQKQPNQEELPGIISFAQLKVYIQEDIRNHFANYQAVKSSFSYHLKNNQFTQQNQQTLVSIIEKLSNYPAFLLHNQQLIAIYKILCYNLHLKSVQTLNAALKFVLIADQNVFQSPIYLQFIRFHLQVPREYMKVKYQIDFQKLSVWQALKQFIGRTVQRGFLSRSPEYQRNLNILDHEQILYRLVKRKQTKESLMIKKLNYTIFMDLKQFYQEEMNENLYHWRKVELMRKFNHRFIQVLAQQIPIIQNESSHLRELYMKLYLTLPSQNKLDTSVNMAQPQKAKLQHEVQVLKIKNVIYLYNLAQAHISRMDSYKLQEISENIDVIIQFVQAVELNFKLLALNFTKLQHFELEFDQMLLITELLHSLQLQESLLFQAVIQKIRLLTNPLLFFTYFPLILKLLQIHTETSSLLWLTESNELLHFLSLEQLHNLCQLIHQHPSQRQSQIFQSISKNVVTCILSRDFEVIGGYQIIKFLDIYNQSLPWASIIGQVQVLRKFIMRYISDHHKQFTLNQFEDILNKLLDLPQNSCSNFQDQDGNYPKHIFEELQPYLNKVDLLLGQKTTQKLAQARIKNKYDTSAIPDKI